LSSRLVDQSDLFDRPDWALAEDGLIPPGLKDAVGTLRCEVVSSMTLRDICSDEHEERNDPARQGEVAGKAKGDEVPGSELFICRVLDVISGAKEVSRLPLLHHQRKYVTTGPIHGEGGAGFGE
jgi:hypothetical protein